MRKRLVVFGIALLGFIAAMGLHVAMMFTITPQAVAFNQNDQMLYVMMACLFFLTIAVYLSMNDGVVFIGNIGCFMTLFAAILRTPPYMMQALILFMIYAVLTSVVVPIREAEVGQVRGYAIAIAAAFMLSMVVIAARLDAENPEWYRLNRKPSRRIPPRKR